MKYQSRSLHDFEIVTLFSYHFPTTCIGSRLLFSGSLLPFNLLVKVRKFLLPMIVVPHRFLSDRLSNKNQEFRDFVNCKAVPNPDTHQVRNSLLIRFWFSDQSLWWHYDTVLVGISVTHRLRDTFIPALNCLPKECNIWC